MNCSSSLQAILSITLCLRPFSIILSLELPNSLQGQVELIWSAKVAEIWCLKHAILRWFYGIVSWLFEGMEINEFWYFNVLHQSLSLILRERGGINFEFEAETIYYFNLHWIFAIQFSHTLNLSELHIITILELMSLVLMHSDNGGISLCDIHNNEGLSLLTISIINLELFSIIEEGIAPGSMALGLNIAYLMGTAELVHCIHVIDRVIHFSVTDYTIVSMIFKGNFIYYAYFHIWV